MSDFRSKVVVGNLVINPAILRKYLLKSHYFLVYKPETETMTLNANHNSGGEVLFEIRNVSYENTVKFAEGLGLGGDGDYGENPVIWSKWNPILELNHDGSEDAESLKMEMLRLGIPHIVHPKARVLGLITNNGQHRHEPPLWTIAKLLQIIRETAERYKENLSTTP